jgi:hypothetical protein
MENYRSVDVCACIDFLPHKASWKELLNHAMSTFGIFHQIRDLVVHSLARGTISLVVNDREMSSEEFCSLCRKWTSVVGRPWLGDSGILSHQHIFGRYHMFLRWFFSAQVWQYYSLEASLKRMTVYCLFSD